MTPTRSGDEETRRVVAGFDDLIAGEYVSRERQGRRNAYTVRTDLPISLPNQRDIDLGSLLSVLLPAGTSNERRGLVSHDVPPG